MAEAEQSTGKRGRGRPRKGASDSREAILVAATELFTSQGYDATSIRAIAVRANVDPSLVLHYFGSKSDLLAASLGSPFRPDVGIPLLIEGDPATLGERIIRYILSEWENPAVQQRTALVLRSSLTSPAAAALLAEFLNREIISRIGSLLAGENVEFRLGLVSSQIAGLIVGRYVLKVPPLVNASPEQLIEHLGETVQRYLCGD